jgi:methanethiol S-methyltransferase
MIWVGLSVLIWGGLHSLLATHKAKELARAWWGEKSQRYYRLLYNLWAGLSFLPILLIAFLVPDRGLYTAPMPWFAMMVAGEILAMIALVVGFRQTDGWEFLGLRQLMGNSAGEHRDGPVEVVKGRLVTSGLYRYVRHPLYTAGLVFIWLLPLMTVNVLAINIAMTIYVVVGAHYEEKKLRLEFGQEYERYSAITPMFIPFNKRNKVR